MPPLISFTKTWPQFVDGSKTVTRRSRRVGRAWRYYGAWRPCAWAAGWQSLKVGDIIQGIEWTPRWKPNGERWVCPDCGWLGDTDPTFVEWPRVERYKAHAKARPECGLPLAIPSLEWRAPERLPGTEGHRRIVSVREELLGDITPKEVALEGFGDDSPEWFIYMYCVGTTPKYDKARPVNRIEFEELS